VAIDAKGSAAASWDGFRSSLDETVQVATLPTERASWQAPLQLADVGGSFVSPLVSMDEKGNGVAVWARGAGASAAVEAANYDGSSPVLEGMSIPRTGQMARPLTFAVSPLAVTTALGQTSWSFGDGSQPTVGTSVTHAFTAPGSYRVTVTTADVLGNTTTASNTVVITPRRKRVCRCIHGRLVLSKARITHRRFRVRGPRTGGRAKRRSVFPLGTTFRFTLSASATVQIEIARSNTHGHFIGTLTYIEHEGNDRIAFRGHVGRHVLRAGHYLAIISASNRIGHSKTAHLSFVIAR
jgi:hypothetical protein